MFPAAPAPSLTSQLLAQATSAAVEQPVPLIQLEDQRQDLCEKMLQKAESDIIEHSILQTVTMNDEEVDIDRFDVAAQPKLGAASTD